MAKARKPFISRKRRREMEAVRAKRESVMQAKEQERLANETVQPIHSGEKQPIHLPPVATVGEFARLVNFPVVKVISMLMRDGVMAAINDQIDFDTMAIIADELGFVPEEASKELNQEEPVTIASRTTEGTETRPPIVTVMGHVDHGKTSLLDKIRQTKIAEKEYGGITQHIGAYQAEIAYENKRRLITFLDTPGHEAFTALRSHGAQVTDIVILVVASDDGVKPQTIEAINHAKSANVPIIVALSKIDLPNANPDRVKQQLTEYGLIPEEWGGDTVTLGVSAKTGEGIQELLEYIALTADIKNYKADPMAPAQGVVIESHQEVGLGPVATVLVQNGTLQTGDVIVIGDTFGKIRSMQTYASERVTKAGPSTPVRIAGLHGTPNFGESFAVTKDEREAKNLAGRSEQTFQHRRSISDISQAIAEGRTDTLRIILKADTQGSLEAIQAAIQKLSQPGVKPLVIQSGIGDISLSDIQLAAASTAVVFGFHTNVPAQVKRTAENQGVTVATFKIIYDLLNQVEMTLKGLIRMKTIRVERGRLKVKKIFRSTRGEQIVGGEITQGMALKNAFVTIQRTGETVAEGKVISLQKGPEAVNELEAGQECGVAIQVNSKILEGDVLVFLSEEQVVASEESPTQ